MSKNTFIYLLLILLAGIMVKTLLISLRNTELEIKTELSNYKIDSIKTEINHLRRLNEEKLIRDTQINTNVKSIEKKYKKEYEKINNSPDVLDSIILDLLSRHHKIELQRYYN